MPHPHRRRNALTGDWVLVSPQRTDRPWQGKQETHPPEASYRHTTRIAISVPGTSAQVANAIPAMPRHTCSPMIFRHFCPNRQWGKCRMYNLLTGEQVTGTSRVVCFSPRHDRTLAQLPVEGIRTVVDTWARETVTLGALYRWVQVFENKGALMGCSNAHPHGQIWAGSALPNEPAKEDREQEAYLRENGSVLLLDYCTLELTREIRIVAKNDRWVALVPYWAVWPFELLLLPRTHIRRIARLYR